MLAALVVVTAAVVCLAILFRGVSSPIPEARLTPAPSIAPSTSSESKRAIRSVNYALTLTTQPGLVPPPDRQRAGGSITAQGDGFLVVTAAGDFYRLSWAPDSDGTLRSDRLSLTLPFNRDAMITAAGAVAARPFRITDLIVADRGGVTRVFVAHHHLDVAARCVSLRVSSAALPQPGGQANTVGEWDTLFDSQPCLSLDTMWTSEERADRSGGRLAYHDSSLLLSVGDYGFDGLGEVDGFAQSADASYGKILLLDMAGSAVPYSIGHRNPQGLAIDRQGRVWSTEHGPEGGDELNLIVRGGNYGWPLATYGTDHDSDVWPLALNPKDHGRFNEPALAFVPAVGVSELLDVGPKYLPHWSGDLLVASLQAGMLLRIRISGDRVVYTEPIDLVTRIRDLAEGQDGRASLSGMTMVKWRR